MKTVSDDLFYNILGQYYEIICSHSLQVTDSVHSIITTECQCS